MEITAVTENRDQFKRRTRENRLGKIITRETIPLTLLRKIYKDFPNKAAKEIIDSARVLGIGRNDEVQNPWHGGLEPIYVEDAPVSDQSLLQHLAGAIEDKVAKKHPGKDQTVLVIDNRSTTFDLRELHEAESKFDTLRPLSPFKEVWFYTGCYSDDDGSNAEWALVPILLPEDTRECFNRAVGQSGQQPNDAGFVFGGF